MIRRLGLATTIAVVAGFALVAPGPAAATTTLGETFVPDSCGTDTYIQTADPGNRYMVPFDGVITSWSYQSDGTPPADLQFKVGRTAPGADLTMNTDVTILAESAVMHPLASTLNTYAAQIPVKAGDRIGEYVTTDCSRRDDSFIDHYGIGDVPAGTTQLFFQENYQQDISAVLQPDCDHDGLADETQDPDTSSCKLTGQRAAALKKCKKTAKKKHWTKKRLNKCKKKARLLPV